MKKLSIILLLFLAACIEEPEIKVQHGKIVSQNTSDPTAILPCELDYKWWHQGTSSSIYSVNGYNNGYHWDVVLAPQWSAGGAGPMYYFPSVDPVQFKMRVRNVSGETFRYRIDEGTWVTLTSGQSGLVFTRTAFGHTPCDNNDAVGPIPFSLDVERLTCGSAPYHMEMRVDCISVSNGHNYGQPGQGINGPIVGHTAEGSPGSCHI